MSKDNFINKLNMKQKRERLLVKIGHAVKEKKKNGFLRYKNFKS